MSIGVYEIRTRIIASVRLAIAANIQPRMNKMGSSGSYFARDLNGHVVGIFKPKVRAPSLLRSISRNRGLLLTWPYEHEKDEEPYGNLNPKYTKWFHRNFLAPFIGFGRTWCVAEYTLPVRMPSQPHRASLIPNLSYQSEAAASLLDRLLESHIVPRTEVVSLSSPSFFYDWFVPCPAIERCQPLTSSKDR
jgi:phosphatidylinositol 4-kinase type 2